MQIGVFGTRGFPGIQGGVERHCECIYPRMARQQDVRVTLYRRRPYVRSTATYAGITFRDLPSTRVKGLEAFLHSFLAALDCLRRRPDVVHIHNIGPGFFAPLLRLFGLRVVLTYHSANYEHSKWNAAERTFLRLCEAIALSTAHAIVFVNRFQMEKYADGIRRKSHYIPNGIDAPMPTPCTAYLDQHGLTPGHYLLAAGRITHEKGFDLLIDAYINTCTDCQLVIAGGVESEQEYARRLRDAADPQRVVFTGYANRAEMNELYTHAALFVLSSRSEGFPIVLLEAMSYGLPVVASDIPATHLVELPDDCYFPAGDAKALREALERKLAAEPHRMTYDMAAFDWDTVAARTLDVCRCVASPHKPKAL